MQMTPDTREIGKSRTTDVRRLRTYGTVKSGGQRHDGALAPRANDPLVQPSDKQPVADRKSFSILWRVVAASGVLGLFALGISVASSRRQTDPTRLRGTSNVDTEDFRVRKTCVLSFLCRGVLRVELRGKLCLKRRVFVIIDLYRSIYFVLPYSSVVPIRKNVELPRNQWSTVLSIVVSRLSTHTERVRKGPSK